MQIGNHFIVLGKAAKLYTGDQEEIDHLIEANEVPPRFNYSWWFWLPKIRIKPAGTITMIDIHWLCYFFYWDNFNLAMKDKR